MSRFVLVALLLMAGKSSAVAPEDESRLASAAGMSIPQLRAFAENCERNRQRTIREVFSLIREEVAKLPKLASEQREAHEKELAGFEQWLNDLKSRERVSPPELSKLTKGEIGTVPRNRVRITHIVDGHTARAELAFRSGLKKEVLFKGVTTEGLHDDTTISVPHCYRVVGHATDTAGRKTATSVPMLEVYDTKAVAEYARLKYGNKTSASKRSGAAAE